MRARTPAGEVDETPAEWEWEIGDIPPPVTIDSGPALETDSTSATFSFSAPESGLAYECSLDGASFQICSSPKVYNGLALGSHTFRVQVFSPDAIVDQTPATYSWTVLDATAPETTIDFGPPAVTGSAQANIAFSSSEPGSSFECSLNGADFASCGSPAQYSGLTPADYTFRVRAVDASGNADSTPATHSWTVVERPETTIDTGPDSDSTSTSATFTFSSNQAGSSFECSLDGGPFLVCSSPHEVTGLTDGDHTLFVRARNGQGIEDDTPAAYDWTVDLPPNTSIVTAPQTTTQDSIALFTFGANEPDVTFECSLDGAPFTDCESPHAVSVADGQHELQVRALDGSGTPDPTPASHTWRVDTAAPNTTIGDGPSASTQSTNATFTFSAGEPGVTFECSLDGSPYSACSSPKVYTGLSVGNHELLIRATDAAGNVEPTPASHEWTVEPLDTTAPETTIGTKPDANTRSTDASFGFSADEQGSTFECSLDGAPFSACTSPRAYSGLASGQHEFRVRATDPAGNVDQTPATHSWSVDALPPETTIGSGAPPSSTTDTRAAFSFTSSEQGSSFECSLDGALFTACTSPRSYSGLSVGTHQFRVRAIDAVGNVDPTPASHSWTITAPAPSCSGSSVTVGAAADSWVLQSSRTQNHGTDSALKVDAKSSANARAAFRFNLPTIPSGCQVADAKLRLYASSYKEGRTLQAIRLTAAWTEGGLTWANQPNTTGAAATVASGSGYREWTVTSQVQAMYAPNANHGFLVRDASENGSGFDQSFHSREKGTDNPPRLVITFG